MNKLSSAICIRYWQACVLLGLTGYAVGNIAAKITGALGI